MLLTNVKAPGPLVFFKTIKVREYKIRIFGKEIIAQVVRDFDKSRSLIFNVATPPGVRRRSSLLLAPCPAQGSS